MTGDERYLEMELESCQALRKPGLVGSWCVFDTICLQVSSFLITVARQVQTTLDTDYGEGGIEMQGKTGIFLQ